MLSYKLITELFKKNKMMNKIILFSTQKYEIKYFNKINKKYNFNIKYEKKSLNINTVNKAKGHNHICIFVNDKANTEQIIKKLHKYNIKTIALRCAGHNNVNLKITKKYNIKVINVKSYSPESIAEYTLGLILNLSRKIHISYQNTQNRNFSLNNLVGFNLHNKTIGIIGTGRIGKILIKILHNFNTKILAYDIIISKEIEQFGAKYTSLKNIYKKSDIISLHCPYNKDNHHMINKNSIKQMKKNVMLINTSRGELIDTKEIIKSIKNKKIGSLGIDVYENEEKIFFKKNYYNIINDDHLNLLLSYKNVLITAHQAFLTKESLINISKTTLKNINKISLNKKCTDCI